MAKTASGHPIFLGGSAARSAGSATFTGSLLNIDTGLTEIQGAIAIVKGATTLPLTAAAYASVDHGADGLLDIYCYDKLGVPALLSATVYWTAWGKA